MARHWIATTADIQSVANTVAETIGGDIAGEDFLECVNGWLLIEGRPEITRERLDAAVADGP